MHSFVKCINSIVLHNEVNVNMSSSNVCGGSGVLIKFNIAICVAPVIRCHSSSSYEVVLTFYSK